MHTLHYHLNMVDVVSIRSRELSASRIFEKTYFALTDASEIVMPAATTADDGGESPPILSKPILMQIRDLLESTLSRGGLIPGTRNGAEEFAVAAGGEPVLRLQLPTSTENLASRISKTAIPMQYDVLEHAVKDIQLQLSYLIAKGISVWSIKPEDVYAVEVFPENWRYVLLTECISGTGGSTDALVAFLRQYVTLKWESTKLYAYLRRLEIHADATWI